jgi:hypothetical protein
MECTSKNVQVASQETYGTLGAIVKRRTGNKQVGFLTNRHVAVDLDYPNQKMYHPLPPNLGPGVYLGAVERATSFITDDVWYGIFAGTNPGTSFLIILCSSLTAVMNLVVLHNHNEVDWSLPALVTYKYSLYENKC